MSLNLPNVTYVCWNFTKLECVSAAVVFITITSNAFNNWFCSGVNIIEHVLLQAMLKDAQFTASIDFDAAVIWPSEVGHHTALHGAETLSRQQSHADHRYPSEGSSRRNTKKKTRKSPKSSSKINSWKESTIMHDLVSVSLGWLVNTLTVLSAGLRRDPYSSCFKRFL